MPVVIRPELHLFGDVCLQIGPASHRLERKAAAMLCILAVDGDTARSILAGWLWPEVDAAGARRNLRQRIFQLNCRAGRVIVAGRQRLRLIEDVDCDLAAADAVPALVAGAGEVLAGFAYDELADFSLWLAALRARLGEHALATNALPAEVRQALTAMVGRLESILLADLTLDTAQPTSTKWVSKRPARRSEK